MIYDILYLVSCILYIVCISPTVMDLVCHPKQKITITRAYCLDSLPDPEPWKTNGFSMFSLWTLNLEPRCRQDLPTWSQDGPKTSNLEPRWPQDLQLGAPPPSKNTEKQMMFMYFSMFLLCWPSCIQSIKQSIDQEINQAINQTANQSVNQSNVR